MYLQSAYPSVHFSLDEDTLKITVGCLTSAYPSVSHKTLKITVGCPLCTYPSIHVETLRITVGCLWSTYPSIRNKNLHTCWTPWSTHETRGLWARPPVLSPVPSQAIHSAARRANLCTTAQASCRPPGTRTGRRRGRHPTPGDPALWTRAKTKAQIWAKGPPDKRKKKRGTFYYRNISGEEIYFYNNLKLIPKNRRRVKLQALQFFYSKTIGL